jgi:hypothetical protein
LQENNVALIEADGEKQKAPDDEIPF